MKTCRFHPAPFILGVSIFAVLAASAQEMRETRVTPKMEAVSLFKNGVAVMTATFPAEKPGIYRWENPPQIIHGTLAVESASPVAVTSALREVERTDKGLPPAVNLAEELAGSGVLVTTKSDKGAPGATYEGKVPAALASPGRAPWDSNYTSLREQPYYGWSYYYGWAGGGADPARGPKPPTLHSNFLPVDGANGRRVYLSMDTIAAVEVTQPGARRIKEEQNTLLFTVGEGGGPVRFSFLCRGATWAPSYQLDLTDPAKLTLKQQSMVRNEALDLGDAEIRVITGFPNIRFATVDSPLGGAPLARFFQQISQLPDSTGTRRRGSSELQQQVLSNAGSFTPQAAVPEGPEEETVPTEDLHFHSIGKRTIEEGGGLLAETASAQAKYERIVTWEIPDYRVEDYWWGWDQRREMEFWRGVQNNAWDAVRFENPLKFPLSGGTATMQEKGAFRGQSQISWTAPGQRATVNVNKALSVTTSASEEEIPSTRKSVDYAGGSRAQARFKGTLVMKNLRAEAVTMQVKVQYTGDFVSADEKPAQRLRGEGKWFLNPRQEMEWQFKLGAGESKTLTYQYEAWVPR
jgi:hypothetical protein